MNLAQAIQAAYDADDRYEAAVKAHGYKSRWVFEWKGPPKDRPALRAAYDAKLSADKAMNAAFVELRRVARCSKIQPTRNDNGH